MLIIMQKEDDRCRLFLHVEGLRKMSKLVLLSSSRPGGTRGFDCSAPLPAGQSRMHEFLRARFSALPNSELS